MRNKIFLIIQAVLMYVSNALSMVSLVLLLNNAIDEEVGRQIFFSGFIVGLFAFAYALVTIVFYFIDAFLKNRPSPVKLIMILKAALIPYYISNFILWGALILGTLNPFLFMAMPLVLLVSICVTYINMITTSIPNTAYSIYALRERKIKPSTLLIISNILQYIFCLDLLGSILLFINFEFKNKQ